MFFITSGNIHLCEELYLVRKLRIPTCIKVRRIWLLLGVNGSLFFYCQSLMTAIVNQKPVAFPIISLKMIITSMINEAVTV